MEACRLTAAAGFEARREDKGICASWAKVPTGGGSKETRVPRRNPLRAAWATTNAEREESDGTHGLVSPNGREAATTTTERPAARFERPAARSPITDGSSTSSPLPLLRTLGPTSAFCLTEADPTSSAAFSSSPARRRLHLSHPLAATTALAKGTLSAGR